MRASHAERRTISPGGRAKQHAVGVKLTLAVTLG
jgi:hypothetical protein